MRECGPCTACCTALAVAELDKATFNRCTHECAAGCDIYPSRPASCADYHCLWIQGHLADEDRPDRLGVIFTTTSDPARPDQGNLPMLVEYRENAFQDARVQKAIQQMLAQKPVVLMSRRGRKVLQPVPLTVAGRPVAPGASG